MSDAPPVSRRHRRRAGVAVLVAAAGAGIAGAFVLREPPPPPPTMSNHDVAVLIRAAKNPIPLDSAPDCKHARIVCYEDGQCWCLEP